MTENGADGAAADLAAFAEGPFWRFSLTAYAKPEVAAACLRLQDEHGLDVNLVLFCLWAGSLGLRLDDQRLAAAAAEARAWQRHAVAPLRQVRRWLKANAAAAGDKAARLRQAVKEQELRAEAIEQERLGRHLEGAGGPADAGLALDNFKAYLRTEGVAYGQEIEIIYNNILYSIIDHQD